MVTIFMPRRYFFKTIVEEIGATAYLSNVKRYRYNKINKTVYDIHEFL